MKKIFFSIYKESLILIRDIQGVMLLFFMPMILVVVVALLQHKTFQNLSETSISVIIVDNDGGEVGESLREGIKNQNIFKVTELIGDSAHFEENAKKQVAEGDFQIGIIIPKGATKAIKRRALLLVKQQVPSIKVDTTGTENSTEINLLFDPVTKESFKLLVKSSFAEFSVKSEMSIIFKTYTKVLDALMNTRHDISYPDKPAFEIKEQLVSEYNDGILPNSTQHNVPAWTLFGMFLICIPVAGNVIKERTDGCLARIKTIPVNYFQIMSGKVAVYVIICVLQAVVILLMGIYILPMLGLPKLQLANISSFLLISFTSAFAATGYGIVIGTLATTQVQASTFGSVSSVILAALGGVWVPVNIMGPVMREISSFSPLNWGVQGFYSIFLRNDGILDILPYANRLFIFFLVCLLISVTFRKYNVKL